MRGFRCSWRLIVDKWSRGAQLKRKNVYGKEGKLYYCLMLRGDVIGWEETMPDKRP